MQTKDKEQGRGSIAAAGRHLAVRGTPELSIPALRSRPRMVNTSLPLLLSLTDGAEACPRPIVKFLINEVGSEDRQREGVGGVRLVAWLCPAAAHDTRPFASYLHSSDIDCFR